MSNLTSHVVIWSQLSGVIEGKEESQIYIDGSPSNRNTKYKNHACIQNTIFEQVWKENAKVPDLWIRVDRKINKNEVFIVNYGKDMLE